MQQTLEYDHEYDYIDYIYSLRNETFQPIVVGSHSSGQQPRNVFALARLSQNNMASLREITELN